MNKTIKSIAVIAALTMITAGSAYGAHWTAGQSSNAELCFEQTEKAASGADPSDLTSVNCTRALRDEELTREDRSAMLFNRGLIQRAQGYLVAAQASLEKAVHLSRTIDKRNLALAEVARELGDYAVAFEQYDLLARAGFGADSEELHAAVLARRMEVQQVLDRTFRASIETPIED